MKRILRYNGIKYAKYLIDENGSIYKSGKKLKIRIKNDSEFVRINKDYIDNDIYIKKALRESFIKIDKKEKFILPDGDWRELRYNDQVYDKYIINDKKRVINKNSGKEIFYKDNRFMLDGRWLQIDKALKFSFGLNWYYERFTDNVRITKKQQQDAIRKKMEDFIKYEL